MLDYLVSPLLLSLALVFVSLNTNLRFIHLFMLLVIGIGYRVGIDYTSLAQKSILLQSSAYVVIALIYLVAACEFPLRRFLMAIVIFAVLSYLYYEFIADHLAAADAWLRKALETGDY